MRRGRKMERGWERETDGERGRGRSIVTDRGKVRRRDKERQ